MKLHLKPILCRRTLALTLGGLALLGLATPAVRAQDAATTAPTKPISLNLHNVPIQTALQLLFTGAGIRNTSIASDVQGFANINVSDVPFDLALRTLLSSVNPPLSSDVIDGVYTIRVARPVPPPAPVVQNTVANADPNATGNASTDNQPKRFYKIPIDKYDAYYIARLLGAQGIVQVGVNDVISGGGGGLINGLGGNNNNRNGGNSGFGGSTGFGGNSGFGGSSPSITSIGGGNTGGFGGGGGYGGGRGGGGFRSYSLTR